MNVCSMRPLSNMTVPSNAAASSGYRISKRSLLEKINKLCCNQLLSTSLVRKLVGREKEKCVVAKLACLLLHRPGLH